MANKGMRILHISTARSWRGGEQQIAYLIAELAQQNTQQFVVCIKDAPFYHWCLANNIPVKGLKKRSSLDLSFASSLKKFSQKNKVAIWHAHDAHAHGFAVYAKAAIFPTIFRSADSCNSDRNLPFWRCLNLV